VGALSSSLEKGGEEGTASTEKKEGRGPARVREKVGGEIGQKGPFYSFREKEEIVVMGLERGKRRTH